MVAGMPNVILERRLLQVVDSLDAAITELTSLAQELREGEQGVRSTAEGARSLDTGRESNE